MKNRNGLSITKSFGVLLLITIFLFNFPNSASQSHPAISIHADSHLTLLQANDAGQSRPAISEKVFTALPVNRPLPVQPQRYHITTDYFNRTLHGVFIDKLRVSGNFTTNLPGKMEKWNNVSVAKSQQLNGEFGAGEPQPYIENFTYEPSEKILQPEFFKDFPFEAVQVKNLVWDMAGIEVFAWGHLDSLKLNKLYEAKQMNGAANLAGLGTFKNNNIQLIWKGISMINNRLCGLIDFRTMDNPLEVKMNIGGRDFNMKGRSHYWGTIYISLTEKVIEYTELLEDVTMEIKWSDQPASQYVYTTRFMKVEKIQ